MKSIFDRVQKKRQRVDPRVLAQLEEDARRQASSRKRSEDKPPDDKTEGTCR